MSLEREEIQELILLINSNVNMISKTLRFLQKKDSENAKLKIQVYTDIKNKLESMV